MLWNTCHAILIFISHIAQKECWKKKEDLNVSLIEGSWDLGDG